MKKSLLIFLALISINAYAEYGISLGVIGAGFSHANEENNFYFTGRLFSFSLQTNAGFGFNLSPFMFSVRMDDTADSYMTFVNFSLYYDIFRKHEEIILGPVASIHAVDSKKPNFFEARLGLQFALCPSEQFIFREILVLEAGYKYNRQQQGVYINIGINLLVALVYIFALPAF